jgi:hypothetical protein
MIRNWKGFGTKRSGIILRCYPDIPLEGLRKAMKNFNYDIRSPGPKIEPGTSRI